MTLWLRFVAILAMGTVSALQTQWCIGGEWQAGAAKRVITPTEPMWMAGYGARTTPSNGKISELYAKALVLQSGNEDQGVIVTLDLVGVDRTLSRRIARAIGEKLSIDPQRVLISTSHTHSGPVVGKNLSTLHYYQLPELHQQRIDAYAERLLEECVQVASEAKRTQTPCTISWGSGSTDFATNRRNNKEAEVPQLRASEKLAGPNDHSVPVLAVRNHEGTLQAVLFGYACHPTVLSGSRWSADYPGYAQAALEDRHPGCVALFFAGCGADQNPLPRQTVELARHYGERLATEVDRILMTTQMQVAQPQLECRYAEVQLPLATLPTLDELKQQLQSSNKSEATRAALLIKQIESGEPLAATYPYPVSYWRIGGDLQLVALGGEVVVDYSLRIKADLRGPVWVAGYAHDVMAYIPSRRVLTEGGYEGGSSMVYYGLPCHWAPELEEVIIAQVRKLAAGK